MGDYYWSWRGENVLPDVRTQVGGYCWAYASIASMEALKCISEPNKAFTPLSIQHLKDCYPFYAEGSSEGSIKKTLQWILDNGGHVYSEEAYPLVPGKTPCVTNGMEPAVTITSIGYVDHDEAKLLDIVKKQPVPAAISSLALIYRVNETDIIKLRDVGETLQRDHAVLITGYGQQNGVKFWEVQNTWGPGVQEDGFFRVERASRYPSGGTGGIATKIYFPRIASVGADNLTGIDPPGS